MVHDELAEVVGEVATGCLGQLRDLLVGVPVGGQFRDVREPRQSEVAELLQAARDQRQEIDRDITVDDRDAVGQAVTLEESHRRVVSTSDDASEEVGHCGVGEHPLEGAVGEVLGGGPQHGAEPIERRRKVGDGLLAQLELARHPVGEVGRQCRLHVGVGHRLAGDVGEGRTVEHDNSRPGRDDGDGQQHDGEHPAHAGGDRPGTTVAA